jgi:transcription elongation factor Elf1
MQHSLLTAYASRAWSSVSAATKQNAEDATALRGTATCSVCDSLKSGGMESEHRSSIPNTICKCCGDNSNLRGKGSVSTLAA